MSDHRPVQDEASSWRTLIEQAERCLAGDDRSGAEVHLVAALERARAGRDASLVAASLTRLGELRVLQRRSAAAERFLTEAIAIFEAERDDDGLARAREALRRARG